MPEYQLQSSIASDNVAGLLLAPKLIARYFLAACDVNCVQFAAWPIVYPLADNDEYDAE